MSIVRHVLLVELVLVALTLVAVFGHALWYRRSARARLVQLAAGREVLLTALASGNAARDAGALRSMPQRALVRLLADIAPSVTGPHRSTLTDIAVLTGLTRSAARSLESGLWWRRLQGARLLTLVGRDVRMLDGLQRDPHPLVRAQRAEALGRHPSPDAASELVEALADRDGAVRFSARESLMRLGVVAQEPIARRLVEESEPVRLIDLLEIATAIPSPLFEPMALAHSASEWPAVRMAAARLLRAIGGASVDRLVPMLGDADAGVRATAADSLGALGHWPAAPALGRMLGDGEWKVRIAAAVALQRLGAPGQLLLRRARDGQESDAADVARQVLEIADRLRVASAS